MYECLQLYYIISSMIFIPTISNLKEKKSYSYLLLKMVKLK